MSYQLTNHAYERAQELIPFCANKQFGEVAGWINDHLKNPTDIGPMIKIPDRRGGNKTPLRYLQIPGGAAVVVGTRIVTVYDQSRFDSGMALKRADTRNIPRGVREALAMIENERNHDAGSRNL